MQNYAGAGAGFVFDARAYKKAPDAAFAGGGYMQHEEEDTCNMRKRAYKKAPDAAPTARRTRLNQVERTCLKSISSCQKRPKT